MAEEMTDTTERLAKRYGRTSSNRRFQRGIGIVTAAGFAVVLGAWLWWGGVLETPAQLGTRDIGYELVSDQEVIVSFEVTTQPGTEVSCAIQALNGSFGIVGWKVMELEPSTQWTRTFSEPLRTSEPAVTGLLYECWLP